MDSAVDSSVESPVNRGSRFLTDALPLCKLAVRSAANSPSWTRSRTFPTSGGTFRTVFH